MKLDQGGVDHSASLLLALDHFHLLVLFFRQIIITKPVIVFFISGVSEVSLFLGFDPVAAPFAGVVRSISLVFVFEQDAVWVLLPQERGNEAINDISQDVMSILTHEGMKMDEVHQHTVGIEIEACFACSLYSFVLGPHPGL